MWWKRWWMYLRERECKSAPGRQSRQAAAAASVVQNEHFPVSWTLQSALLVLSQFRQGCGDQSSALAGAEAKEADEAGPCWPILRPRRINFA